MKRISLSRAIFAAFILAALSFQTVPRANATDCPEGAAAAVTEARRALAASDPAQDRRALECLIEAVSTLEKTLMGLRTGQVPFTPTTYLPSKVIPAEPTLKQEGR
ncbi:MAG: hypothetical protein WC807_18290 [Hyphomicrobium sp.]|jgi:hypothetical protein